MSEFHYMREAMAALKEIAEESNNKQQEADKKAEQEFKDKEAERNSIKEEVEFARDRHMRYKDAVTHECLKTALNGIYVSAIQRDHVLTKENINICETMMENFIKEEGGAYAVLRKMKNSTPLLEAVRRIIIETEEEVVQQAEEEEKDTGDTTQQDTEEVPEENKDELLDKMENEEDVDSAVDIIANRIAQAEEEFVKKNAEDKEKIEQIVQDVNDRIEAVKGDVTTDEEEKSEEEEQLEQEATNNIRDIEYKKSMSLFEKMVREMYTSVTKDQELKESYTNYENNKIDLTRIVGNVVCMYGFLEFCNTTQIKKIDEEYIRERFINN